MIRIALRKKRCSRCGEIRLMDMFAKDSRSPDGKQCYCRSCKRVAFREFLKKKGKSPPAKWRAWQRYKP